MPEKKTVKPLCSLLRYAAVFLASVLLMFGLTVLSALIPRETIRGNALASAEYLASGDAVVKLIDKTEGSYINRKNYAAALGIAWQYDSGSPLTSTMLSGYYKGPEKSERGSLTAAVEEDLAPNRQRLAGWHGSAAVLRIMLVFTELKTVYIINAVILAGLAVWLVILTLRRRDRFLAFTLLFGMAAVSFWTAPFALTSFWCCSLTPALTIGVLLLSKNKHWQGCTALLLIGGVLTAYFDEFTSGLMTLLVPLAVLLREYHRDEGNKPALVRYALKSALAWTVGFVGMYALKWLLAAVILGGDPLPYVSDFLAEQIRSMAKIKQSFLLKESIPKNIGCLFPFGYGGVGKLAAGLFGLLLIYQCFIYYKKGCSRKYLILLAVGAILPYILFLVFAAQSRLSSYDTFRSQMILPIAAVFAAEELTRSRGDEPAPKRFHRKK